MFHILISIILYFLQLLLLQWLCGRLIRHKINKSLKIYRIISYISPGFIWFFKSFVIGLSVGRQDERMKKLLIFFIKTFFIWNVFAEAFTETCQTPKMETFAKTVNGLKLFCKKLHLGCLTWLWICLCTTSKDFTFL